MTLAMPRRVGYGGILERSDFWRRSPATAGGALGHKEWSYFCVFGDVDLLVAFSIMDRPAAPDEPPRPEAARVTLLTRTSDGTWSGTVDPCAPGAVAIRAGGMNARFGASLLSFARGEYRLDVAGVATDMAASVTLTPVARPAMTRSVPLGPAAPMFWFVVPRLQASGHVRIGPRRYALRAAPAYHDHNWGEFSWGGDFAWEWAIALSTAPPRWSLVYYRITDGGRHAVTSQGVLLWREDRHRATFRDSDLTVRSHDWLRTSGCLRLPGIMHVAVPGSASDLPRRLQVEAAAGNDTVDVEFVLDDCAQIGLPHDADDGITVLSECHSRAIVRGSLRGERLSFECPAVVEFNRAAC